MAAEKSPLPSHVGIIMDGNGRWASERGMPRTSGHKEGLEVAKRIVAHAAEKGIQVLSLYVFSTENWRRSRDETDFLMNLIRMHLRRQYDFYREHKLKIIHSGNLEPLPKAVREEIALAESDTAEFEGMKVNILVNYGGQNEIVRAVRHLAAEKTDLSALTELQLSEGLDCPVQLDLLIRTGGERRLSNFLLWQAAYAELYFSNVYWPDWSPLNFDVALSCYQSRQRRFGGNGY